MSQSSFRFALALAFFVGGCGDDDTPLDAGPDAAIDVLSSDVAAPDALEDATAADAGSDATIDGAAVDAAACESMAPLTVHLVGDSTTASGSGWGDFLEPTFGDEILVTNSALSGASSRSFYEGDRFTPVRDALEEGDYLLIQFGHNDSKSGDRRTEPGMAPDFLGTFREYLQRYIDEARSMGATPVLLTPVSRMTFNSDGEHNRTHGDYARAIRRVAVDNDLVLLDLEERSHMIFQELGEEETVLLYAGFRDEPSDRTHFPIEKAFRVADMVAMLLAESGSSLRCELR